MEDQRNVAAAVVSTGERKAGLTVGTRLAQAPLQLICGDDFALLSVAENGSTRE